MSANVAVTAGGNKYKRHLTSSALGAADTSAPLLSEVQAFVDGVAGLWTSMVYYTGTDTPTDNATYVYDVSSAGEVTLLLEPSISVNGLLDTELAITSPSGLVNWNTHTRISSATAGDLVILDTTANGVVGDILEVFNSTPNILTLQLDAGDSSLAATFDPTIGPNSGFSCRIVAANTVEVIGTGMTNYYVNGVEGYSINGDIMMQWGIFNVASQGDLLLPFHTKFGIPPYFVSLSANRGSTGGDNTDYAIDYSQTTTEQALVNLDTGSATGEYRYFAIGQRQ